MAADETAPPDERSEKFFGRRRGRQIRVTQQGLFQTLLPQVEIRTEDLPAEPGSLRLETLFPERAHLPVWLEVGFGGGEHLAEQAARHPDINFIGAEPFLNGVGMALTHVERLGLTNLRILADDVRPLLDALPAGCLGRAYVLYADPWPKRRHRDRRFIGPANLPRLARLLQPAAELRLASDDPTLIDWMLWQVTGYPDFEWTAESAADWRTAPADWVPTRYELKALKAGRRPAYFLFRRAG